VERVITNALKQTSPLQEREYYEVCAKVSSYQYGTPTAFKLYDVEYSKFYLDGIQFIHGKEEQHLWSYVIGASKTYNEEKKTPELRKLCPSVSSPSFTILVTINAVIVVWTITL